MEVQAAPVLRERTRVECHEGILKGLIRHSTDRMGKTQTTGMPEKQRKTKDLSYRRALKPHCDPWCTHRTITRIAPCRILKENKPAAIYGPSYPKAERQVRDSQRWKARGHCNLSPRDCTFRQAVSRLPVTNHVYLGAWTVHICLKCHNLRPAPLRGCRAHLGLSSQCKWESK